MLAVTDRWSFAFLELLPQLKTGLNRMSEQAIYETFDFDYDAFTDLKNFMSSKQKLMIDGHLHPSS